MNTQKTRTKKGVFTLHHPEHGAVTGDRRALRDKTGLCAEYVRALTNRARYSLRGWSWDSNVEPRARGQRFTERSKANA